MVGFNGVIFCNFIIGERFSLNEVFVVLMMIFVVYFVMIFFIILMMFFIFLY